MNLFRSFSIKLRILTTFVLSALLPIILFIYIQFTGIVVSDSVALFLGAVCLFVAIVSAILVSASIAFPIDSILSALKAFQTKKSAASVSDSGSDELSEVASELNRIFSEWNHDIVSMGKKQFQQSRDIEKNELQLSQAEKNLDLTRSCLKVAQQLNTTFDFQANLKAILDEALRTMNVQWASVLLINREKHELAVACVRGVEQTLMDDLTDSDYPAIRLKPNEGLAGHVIKEGLPVIANKGHKDPRFKLFSEFSKKDHKVASILCSPIIGTDGTVLGVLNLINRISPPVFRNEDLPYTQDLCTLTSIIIERNKMYKNLFEDSQTGLAAYNVWNGFFQEESSRAVRYLQPLTVCVIDIDNYKAIATETNPEFASEVTTALGTIVKRALRDTDLAANIQERFYLLLPNTDPSGGVFLIGRLKEDLEKETFSYNQKNFSITISAGIASYPDSITDAKQLPACAISSLSLAKNQGGNRAIIFQKTN